MLMFGDWEGAKLVSALVLRQRVPEGPGCGCGKLDRQIEEKPG